MAKPDHEKVVEKVVPVTKTLVHVPACPNQELVQVWANYLSQLKDALNHKEKLHKGHKVTKDFLKNIEIGEALVGAGCTPNASQKTALDKAAKAVVAKGAKVIKVSAGGSASKPKRPRDAEYKPSKKKGKKGGHADSDDSDDD